MLEELQVEEKTLNKLLQDLNGPTIVSFNDEIEHTEPSQDDEFQSIVKVINSFDPIVSKVMHSVIVDENTLAQTAKIVRLSPSSTRRIYDNTLPLLQEN